MVFIYGLFSENLCWYVGSTVNTARREQEHRSLKDSGVGSADIPGEYNWILKVLEECEDDMRLQVERQWYENLKPLLNKCHPGRSNTEIHRMYRKRDNEHYKAYWREYHKLNREKILEKHRRYRARKKAAKMAVADSASHPHPGIQE